MAKKGKDKKGGKDKGKNKGKKGQQSPAVNAPPTKPEPPPKPKPNPCVKECPIYFVLDVRKCLRSPKYDKFFGPDDEFIYFPKIEDLHEFFDKLKVARERKQQWQETCVDQILEQYAGKFENEFELNFK